MKRVLLAIVCFYALSASAYTVKHTPTNFILSRFKVCNKLSYPVYFSAWALDRPKAYRWNGWVQTNECREDLFEKYYDSALYEFTIGPYETPFRTYILREGETFYISPFH